MRLEDYFEFEKFDTKFGPVERIRIGGFRISIEHVVELYEHGVNPESIVRDHYPCLSLEQVFATLTYWQREKVRVEEYRRRSDEVGELHYQEWAAEPPSPLLLRLRELKAQRDKGVATGS